MTVLDFIESKGWKYKLSSSGKEATLETCPYCHDNHWRFNVNLETGQYICNRQNNCGAKGVFKLDKKENKKSVDMDKLRDKFDTLSKTQLEYLKGRGISEKTTKEIRVLNRNGAMCFFYTDINGKATGVKYRTLDKKIWSETNSDMTLLNWDRVPKDAETLIITEGECFKGNVEIFTEKGFIRFEDLKDEKVLQVKEDLTGEFVKPLAKIKKTIDDELISLKSSRNNWEHTSTKNHNLVVIQNGNIKKITAEKVSKGIAGKIPTTVNFDGTGTGLSKDEIALIIAVSADSKCDVRKNGEMYFHFGLKKQRKVDRLLGILDRLGIKYTCYRKNYGYTTINFKSSKIKKGLPKEWVYQMTLEERKFFIEEIVEWDGNRVPNRKQYEFSSKLLHENEIVQAIAHTCGYMSTIIKRKNNIGEWYKTSILLAKNSVSWCKNKYELEKYKGYVYCVTVPSGMILVRINGKITVTGNCDMMSAYEVGFKNVVSVPNGTKSQEWIEKHYTWLERFKTIVLCLDNDQAGQEAIKQIADRLSDLKAELKTVDLLFYKDLNEVLQDDDGATKLKNILTNNVKDLELSNTYILSQVKCDDDVVPIDTGDDAFNRLTGGFRFGEVWIFTGNAGSGKSTFLNNMMANILNQGYSVYTHQGEFKPSKFKTNLYKIMSRPSQIETYRNEFKSMVYGRVSKNTEEQIDEWLGDRLVIHGSQVPKKNELIKTMEQMYKRNGIKFFFIDNLMTIGIDGDDKYEQQKLLFLDLQAFAKKYNVFVGVVAHPKKNNLSLEEVDQYIIHGGSEISNLTNFIVILKRLNDAEKEKLEELDIQATIGGCCLKDREYGDVNKIEYWDFEKKTGRFLSIRNKEFSLNKKYKWEDYQDIKAELEEELPF